MTDARLAWTRRYCFDVKHIGFGGVVVLLRTSPAERRAQAMTCQQRLVEELALGRQAAVSRSYTGDFAACAAVWRTDGVGRALSVGVDIQHDEGVDSFPDQELDGVAQQLGFELGPSASDRRATFFRRWTELEARGKACGTGLSLSPAKTLALTAEHWLVDLDPLCLDASRENETPLFGALCVGW